MSAFERVQGNAIYTPSEQATRKLPAKTNDSLIAFLTARLDEDEAVAMKATGTAWAWEATGDKDNSWALGHVEDEDGRPLSGEIEHGQGVVIDGVCESIDGKLADAAHITRHDPARALREVEAKRAIVDLAAKTDEWTRGSAGATAGYAALIVKDSLRAIAAVYSDHPDYRDEWKS